MPWFPSARASRHARPGRSRLPRRLACLAAPALVAVGLAGCAETLDNPAKLVSQGLYNSVGQRPKSVHCPSNVTAKVGHVFTCKVVINSTGDYVVATVKETSVKGSTVHVSISDSTKIYKP